MSDPILLRLGTRRALEGAIELLCPLALAAGAWWAVREVLGGLTASCGVTALEFTLVVGAAAALTGWALARTLYLFRLRRPRVGIGAAWLSVLVALYILEGAADGRFRAQCEAAGGVVTQDRLSARFDAGAPPGGRPVCRIGAVANNLWLPGALLRPRWTGPIAGPFWALFLAFGGLAALGGRDRRLVLSRLGTWQLRTLALAPASGWASAPVGAPKADERVEACGNVTWWGELCGQIYPTSKAPKGMSACVRCHQVFRAAERRLTMKVVSLTSDDVDELNGWERQDTVSWVLDQNLRQERPVSGRSRWAVLGTIDLPDVLTVAQSLAIVHARLPTWAEKEENPRAKRSYELAITRASRVSAWLWAGATVERLTRARPEREASLAVGPQRLRDLVPTRGERLWLQLDIGLMPLDIWEGERKGDEAPRNLRFAMWLPVAPPRNPSAVPGVWVPRIEGAALRTWLQVTRRSGERVAVPAPYCSNVDAAQTPRQGPLDFAIRAVRHPKNAPEEPDQTPTPGDSLSEWLWFERAQIQLLRRSALVLVERR